MVIGSAEIVNGVLPVKLPEDPEITANLKGNYREAPSDDATQAESCFTGAKGVPESNCVERQCRKADISCDVVNKSEEVTTTKLGLESMKENEEAAESARENQVSEDMETDAVCHLTETVMHETVSIPMEEDKEGAVGILTGVASSICENVTTASVHTELKDHKDAAECMGLTAPSNSRESKLTAVVVNKNTEAAKGGNVDPAGNNNEAVANDMVNSELKEIREDTKGMEMWDYWDECVSQLEPLDGVKLSDHCCEFDTPFVVRKGVSDVETQCINVTEGELSPIERSQEASVSPQS